MGIIISDSMDFFFCQMVFTGSGNTEVDSKCVNQSCPFYNHLLQQQRVGSSEHIDVGHNNIWDFN